MDAAAAAALAGGLATDVEKQNDRLLRAKADKGVVTWEQIDARHAAANTLPDAADCDHGPSGDHDASGQYRCLCGEWMKSYLALKAHSQSLDRGL